MVGPDSLSKERLSKTVVTCDVSFMQCLGIFVMSSMQLLLYKLKCVREPVVLAVLPACQFKESSCSFTVGVNRIIVQ